MPSSKHRWKRASQLHNSWHRRRWRIVDGSICFQLDLVSFFFVSLYRLLVGVTVHRGQLAILKAFAATDISALAIVFHTWRDGGAPISLMIQHTTMLPSCYYFPPFFFSFFLLFIFFSHSIFFLSFCLWNLIIFSNSAPDGWQGTIFNTFLIGKWCVSTILALIISFFWCSTYSFFQSLDKSQCVTRKGWLVANKKEQIGKKS